MSTAWAAGFFDGEGYIGLQFRRWSRGAKSSGKRRWGVQLVLTNTDRNALTVFASVVGVGSIYARKVIPGRRPCFCWYATSRAAETVLRLLLPFLVVKRELAELALESRALIQKTAYARIPDADVSRLVDLENRIKTLNGNNRNKALATIATRAYVEVD